MADRQINGTLEGLATFVVGCADEPTASSAARLALVKAGKTPGHPIYADDLGDGTWEVVFTNRPLRPDQSFNSIGQRIGNAGSRAD